MAKANQPASVEIKRDSGQTESKHIATDPLLRVAIPRLLRLLADQQQSWETRITAVVVCLEVVPPQQLLPHLIPLMKEKELLIRQASIAAAGVVFQSIPEEDKQVRETCKLLLKVLENKKESLECRFAAAGAIGLVEIYREETTQSFMRVIEDKNDDVQFRLLLSGGLQLTTPPAQGEFGRIPIVQTLL